MDKKLYRSKTQVALGGVCGGIAEYFDVDVTIIRLLFVLLFFMAGTGFLFYLIAWIIIPENPYQINEQDYKSNSNGDNPSMGKKPNQVNKKRNNAEIFGWILIGFGALFLIKVFIPWLSFNVFWPIVLIVLGLAIIMKKM